MTDHERLCELLDKFSTNHIGHCDCLGCDARRYKERLRSNGPDGLRVVPYAAGTMNALIDNAAIHAAGGERADG